MTDQRVIGVASESRPDPFSKGQHTPYSITGTVHPERRRHAKEYTRLRCVQRRGLSLIEVK